jgi:hypothetical protein
MEAPLSTILPSSSTTRALRSKYNPAQSTSESPHASHLRHSMYSPFVRPHQKCGRTASSAPLSHPALVPLLPSSCCGHAETTHSRSNDVLGPSAPDGSRPCCISFHICFLPAHMFCCGGLRACDGVERRAWRTLIRLLAWKGVG